MSEPQKMIIYNLFPLLAGKFDQWDSHLERAAEMGFNWIFVNPIQYPGFSGSLYSIKDYFAFHQLMINEESKDDPKTQIKKMLNHADKLGLKVMVDLVINHCAVDSAYVKDSPQWFEWENGQVAHPFCMENGHKVVWGDLAKFNHRHTNDPEGLYKFFKSIVDFLVDCGFSGFRCDAAYQLPRNLWERLIKDTKHKNPDILFFAETLGCTADQTRRTAEAGFDYIFNSSKWWDFEGHWLMENYELTRSIAPSIGFPESHDTIRLCEEYHGNINALKLRYLFTALFSGGVMMPIGFEYGFRRSLHVVKSRPEDWEDTGNDLTGFIKKVNDIKGQYSIFHEDSPTQRLYCCHNPNVVIFWKGSTRSKEEALLIYNKDIHNKQNVYIESLSHFIQAGSPLSDVSPEYPMEFIPEPFSYDLNPGQGLIYVTTRDVDREY